MSQVVCAKLYLTLETTPQDIATVTVSALQVKKLRIRGVKNLFTFTKLVNVRGRFQTQDCQSP